MLTSESESSTPLTADRPPLLVTGQTWEQMQVGTAFRTPGRTVTETDPGATYNPPVYSPSQTVVISPDATVTVTVTSNNWSRELSPGPPAAA